MIPTRLRLRLDEFYSSEFPYFAASNGPLTAICGGGGVSKSGVPNLLEIYQENLLLTTYNFEEECIFYIQPMNKSLFTAGTAHLSEIDVAVEEEKIELKLVKEHEISEPHGLELWNSYIILAESNKISIFDQDMSLLQEEEISNIKQLFINKYSLKFELLVNCRDNLIILTSDKENELLLKQQVLDKEFKEVLYTCDNVFIAFFKKELFIYDKSFCQQGKLEFDDQIALLRYDDNDNLLFVILSSGKLIVYENVQSKLVKKAATQLAATSFIVDFEYEPDTESFICISVDGRQRGQIYYENYAKYYFLLIVAISLLIAHFIQK